MKEPCSSNNPSQQKKEHRPRSAVQEFDGHGSIRSRRRRISHMMRLLAKSSSESKSSFFGASCKIEVARGSVCPSEFEVVLGCCMSQYYSHLRRQARTSTRADSRANSKHDSCPCDRAYSKACKNTLLKPSCGTRFPRSLSKIRLCPNMSMLRAATKKNPNPRTGS